VNKLKSSIVINLQLDITKICFIW